jgi:hypothetical protein
MSPGGAGTHAGHTRDTRAHNGTRITQTNLKTIQTHLGTHQPVLYVARQGDDRRCRGGAADSTAAGPEPTAPRGLPVTGWCVTIYSTVLEMLKTTNSFLALAYIREEDRAASIGPPSSMVLVA